MPGMSSSPTQPGSDPFSAGDPNMAAAGGNIPMGGFGASPSMTDIENMYGGMSHMQDMAMQFGDTPEERTANARAFATLVDQLGKMGKTISDSTILQRMMKGRIRPIAQLSSGQQAGGVGAMPSTLPPGVAQSVMSQMGYK